MRTAAERAQYVTPHKPTEQKCLDLISDRLWNCSVLHGSCQECPVQRACTRLYDELVAIPLSPRRVEAFMAKFQALQGLRQKGEKINKARKEAQDETGG